MSATSWTHQRAKVASLSRIRSSDDPELIEARQKLKALKLEEHVAKIVAEAPPLTPEQADKIAALLRPAGGGAK